MYVHSFSFTLDLKDLSWKDPRFDGQWSYLAKVFLPHARTAEGECPTLDLALSSGQNNNRPRRFVCKLQSFWLPDSVKDVGVLVSLLLMSQGEHTGTLKRFDCGSAYFIIDSDGIEMMNRKPSVEFSLECDIRDHAVTPAWDGSGRRSPLGGWLQHEDVSVGTKAGTAVIMPIEFDTSAGDYLLVRLDSLPADDDVQVPWQQDVAVASARDIARGLDFYHGHRSNATRERSSAVLVPQFIHHFGALPAWAFFAQRGPAGPASFPEPYLLELIDASLFVNGQNSREWLADGLGHLLPGSEPTDESDAHAIDALETLFGAIALAGNLYPYTPDTAIVDGKTVGVERMSDVSLLGTGDCEDSARVIYQVAEAISRDMHEDPLLNACYRVLRAHYIPFACSMELRPHGASKGASGDCHVCVQMVPRAALAGAGAEVKPECAYSLPLPLGILEGTMPLKCITSSSLPKELMQAHARTEDATSALLDRICSACPSLRPTEDDPYGVDRYEAHCEGDIAPVYYVPRQSNEQEHGYLVDPETAAVRQIQSTGPRASHVQTAEVNAKPNSGLYYEVRESRRSWFYNQVVQMWSPRVGQASGCYEMAACINWANGSVPSYGVPIEMWSYWIIEHQRTGGSLFDAAGARISRFDSLEEEEEEDDREKETAVEKMVLAARSGVEGALEEVIELDLGEDEVLRALAKDRIVQLLANETPLVPSALQILYDEGVIDSQTTLALISDALIARLMYVWSLEGGHSTQGGIREAKKELARVRSCEESEAETDPRDKPLLLACAAWAVEKTDSDDALLSRKCEALRPYLIPLLEGEEEDLEDSRTTLGGLALQRTSQGIASASGGSVAQWRRPRKSASQTNARSLSLRVEPTRVVDDETARLVSGSLLLELPVTTPSPSGLPHCDGESLSALESLALEHDYPSSAGGRAVFLVDAELLPRIIPEIDAFLSSLVRRGSVSFAFRYIEYDRQAFKVALVFEENPRAPPPLNP